MGVVPVDPPPEPPPVLSRTGEAVVVIVYSPAAGTSMRAKAVPRNPLDVVYDAADDDDSSVVTGIARPDASVTDAWGGMR